MRSTILLSDSSESSKRYKKLRALLKNIIEPNTVQLLEEQINSFHHLFFTHQLTGRQAKYILSDLNSSLYLIDLYSQLADFCQTQDGAFRNTEEYQHGDKLKKTAAQLTTKIADIHQEKKRLTHLLNCISEIINTPADRRTNNDIKLLDAIKNSHDEKLLDDISAFPDDMSTFIKTIETRSKDIKCIWQTVAKKILESKALLFSSNELQPLTDLESEAEKFKEATATARHLLSLNDLITLKQDFYHWMESANNKKIQTMRALLDLLTNIDGCVFDQCQENSPAREKLVKLIGDHDKLIPTSINVTPLIAKIASIIKTYDRFKSEYKEIKACVKHNAENQQPTTNIAIEKQIEPAKLSTSNENSVAKLIKLFDQAAAAETFNRSVQLVRRKSSARIIKEHSEPTIQYKREHFHRRVTDAHMPKLLKKAASLPKKTRAETFFTEIFKEPARTTIENENIEELDECKSQINSALI